MACYELFLKKIFPFIGNMLKAYEAKERETPEEVEHHIFMDLEMNSISGKHIMRVDGVEQELPNDFGGYFFKGQDIISITAMEDINTFVNHKGDLGFFAESLIFVPTSFTEESTYNDLICLPIVDMETMSGIEYTDVFPTIVPGSMEPTGETISAQEMGFKKLHIKSYVNQEEGKLKLWAEFICID